ncbi:MAG: DUF2490 domain-containing protein [Candidatus Omnitrophica bacterium]|nr:DUF2490 domain-containing protein [Candidatus Omnitrophota bacterium]
MIKRLGLAAAIFLFTFTGESRSEDDFQYWSRFQIKALDTNYLDFITFAELRMNEDASNLGFWQTAQKLAYDPWKHLSLGMNYTYLESESFQRRTRDTEFKHHHRFELEINPSWGWKDKLKLKNRNRFEFRWIEDQGSDHTRYRSLWELDLPLKKLGPLVSLYTNNEFFVDFNGEEINENRVTPLGATFKLYKKSTLKIFYMIQSRKGVSDWFSNQVIGSHVSLTY